MPTNYSISLADYAMENEIFLEHVLYNNSSMLLQLGHNLEEMVVTLVSSPPSRIDRNGHSGS